VDCRETEELFGSYRDKKLESALRLELESHLQQCAACTAELRRLTAGRGGLVLPALSAPRAGRWPMVALAAAACVAAFLILRAFSSGGTTPH